MVFNWDDYSQTNNRLDLLERLKKVRNDFKAPGWQISDASYLWLLRHNWWVADQDYNDERRPKALRVYKIGSNWHGHIQDVMGNGLEETWDRVLELVKSAEGFNFISEVV